MPFVSFDDFHMNIFHYWPQVVLNDLILFYLIETIRVGNLLFQDLVGYQCRADYGDVIESPFLPPRFQLFFPKSYFDHVTIMICFLV